MFNPDTYPGTYHNRYPDIIVKSILLQSQDDVS